MTLFSLKKHSDEINMVCAWFFKCFFRTIDIFFKISKYRAILKKKKCTCHVAIRSRQLFFIFSKKCMAFEWFGGFWSHDRESMERYWCIYLSVWRRRKKVFFRLIFHHRIPLECLRMKSKLSLAQLWAYIGSTAMPRGGFSGDWKNKLSFTSHRRVCSTGKVLSIGCWAFIFNFGVRTEYRLTFDPSTRSQKKLRLDCLNQ